MRRYSHRQKHSCAESKLSKAKSRTSVGTLHIPTCSPKPSVRCRQIQSDSKLLSGFPWPIIFKPETTITCLDMLQLYLPQLEHHQPDVVFHQDGAPPNWARVAPEFLDIHFPGRWAGRDGPIPWPPRSPDITPLDFFL
jgi:hypothetical protein